MTIEEYIKKLCAYLGIEGDCNLEIEELEKRIRVSITVSDSEASLFIGSYGERLEAIELLLKMIFQDEEDDKTIVFDVNDYRLRREEKIIEKALALAEVVLQSGEKKRLSRLNSYERYLVHLAISEDPSLSEVETESFDSEDGRVLLIKRKDS
ncbi:MAG: protein jag [Patescibacteria group bacterium]